MPIYKGEPTKDGRRYYFMVSWSVGGDKQRYKSKKFKFLEDAKKAEARYLLNLNKSIAQRFTFNEMIDEYLAMKEKQVKITTVRNARNCLEHARKVLGNVRVNKLTAKQWEDFLTYLKEQPMKNHRRNRIIEYTIAVTKYAYKRHDVFTNIPEKFDKFNEKADEPVDKKMEFWTPDQFQRFISVVDDVMFKALFILLYSTGMRSGEALALYWSDIDFETGNISITKTVNTKMGKVLILPPKTKSSIRTIRAPQKALDALSEYHKQVIDHPAYSPSAFVFGLDRPIPNSTLQKKKHDYYKAIPNCDFDEIRLHSFRHSTASNLIHSGKLSVVFISKYLGHSSVKETLDTYAHFFPNETDIVAGVMDDIL